MKTYTIYLLSVLFSISITAQIDFIDASSLLPQNGTFYSWMQKGACDMNNDRLDDIVRSTTTGNFYLLTQQKMPGLPFIETYLGKFLPASPLSIMCCDVNNDDFRDILTGGDNTGVKLLLSNQGANVTAVQLPGLIAAGKYTEAYMINWESNVFPGVLGRTCDRPCEPACRRGRVEEEPVAICRLKRVAADFKDDISALLPDIPETKNGKKIALIGAGPAALSVARDLAPLGYELHIYDNQHKGGGMMRSQIPSFRLPASVLDQEVNYILNMGVVTTFNTYITSLKEILYKLL